MNRKNPGTIKTYRQFRITSNGEPGILWWKNKKVKHGIRLSLTPVIS